jgi:PDZ domain
VPILLQNVHAPHVAADAFVRPESVPGRIHPGATFFKLVIIQDENPRSCAQALESFLTRQGTDGGETNATIWNMKFRIAACASFLLCAFVVAQDNPALQSEQNSVTVPAAIDHNRVVINADIALPNGATERVHAWVDNGDPDLYLSRRLATLLGLAVSCDDKQCSAPPPPEMTVGGMKIPLTGLKRAKIPLKPVNAASVLAPGMNVEITLPSSILRHYDVLLDFPGRRFLIGAPGTIHFRGPSGKVQLNAENGLIQVPSQIENKKYNLALDVGASFSFLSAELFDKLAVAHPDWPHMTGAVGSANMWGLEEEPKWEVMRVDRVQYGPLFLARVPVVSFPKDRMDFFAKRASMPTAGLLGSNALLNYRIGIDYAHSTVYFEFGRTFNFPEFDVIGLTLRPEDDGRFTILGVADFDGKPSVPQGADGVQPGDRLVAVDGIPVLGSTMGQVWNMLGGTPGQERKLTIERGGRQFNVAAMVQHFLGEPPDEKEKKKK